MSFTGFPSTGLALLARLPSLDPTRFVAERPNWDELLAQARHFVTDVGAALAERISPDLVADPRVNGSIAPINRDLRFDPHGPRYKDHLLFRWWEGIPKKTAPTLYVRLDPTRIGFASGIVFTSTDRWRAAVAASADGLNEILADIRRTVPDFEVAGADLKRVPTPFPPDHPGADLLRHKAMFQLRWAEPLPNEVTTPGLVDHSASRLDRLAALHRWLRAEVESRTAGSNPSANACARTGKHTLLDTTDAHLLFEDADMTVNVKPSVLIHRSPADVAAFMFDPVNDLRWTGGITASTPAQPGPLTEGNTVTRTAKFLGRTFTYGYLVTHHEPDRLLELKVERPFPMTVRHPTHDPPGPQEHHRRPPPATSLPGNLTGAGHSRRHEFVRVCPSLRTA